MGEQERHATGSILVVDDDSATRSLISEALKRGGFCDTQEFESGAQAIEALQKNHFDLVISDLKMPGMSGLDLLTQIKDLDSSPPVIIVTGYPTTDITVTAMKEGAVDFLVKPFRIEDLLFKVKLYLQEKSFLTEEEQTTRSTNWQLNDKIRELSTIKLIGERFEKTRGNRDDIFEDIVTLALNLTSAERCLIVLYDEARDLFYKKTYHDTQTDSAGSDIAGNNLLNTMSPLFRKITTNHAPLLFDGEHELDLLESGIAVPLLIRNKIFGILAVVSGSHHRVFTRKDLSHIQNLAERASLFLENTILYESLFSSIMNTFKSLIHSIQVRDNYTERHSRSVTEFALITAREMECSAYEIESLRIAAHLHDIGKIAVPDSILLKPDRLTDEEYAIITTHSTIGESILQSIALFDQERMIVRHHHERWDGRGYPDGIAHDDIPLLARILTVADTFDAMTSNRPYRKGLPVGTAKQELTKNRWTQLDGNIVDAFLSALSRAEEKFP